MEIIAAGISRSIKKTRSEGSVPNGKMVSHHDYGAELGI